MIFRTLALAGALSCALAAPPAEADPLTDAIESIFSPSSQVGKIDSRSARLHPSSAGWRRIRDKPLRADGASVVASWYGGHGERLNARTASGERFNAAAMICAHRSLPFGTHLLVSYGGRSVVVRVADRGPAAWTGRSLDLSRAAAARLAMIGAGVARVQVQILR